MLTITKDEATNPKILELQKELKASIASVPMHHADLTLIVAVILYRKLEVLEKQIENMREELCKS